MFDSYCGFWGSGTGDGDYFVSAFKDGNGYGEGGLFNCYCSNGGDYIATGGCGCGFL